MLIVFGLAATQALALICTARHPMHKSTEMCLAVQGEHSPCSPSIHEIELSTKQGRLSKEARPHESRTRGVSIHYLVRSVVFVQSHKLVWRRVPSSRLVSCYSSSPAASGACEIGLCPARLGLIGIWRGDMSELSAKCNFRTCSSNHIFGL